MVAGTSRGGNQCKVLADVKYPAGERCWEKHSERKGFLYSATVVIES